MKRIVKVLLGLLLCAGCLWGTAGAESAQNITADCTFTTSGKPPYSYKLLYDQKYQYSWKTPKLKNVYLEVTLPEGQTCSGVQIKWGRINPRWQIELWDGTAWQPYHKDESGHLTTWTPLPEVTRFRIAAHHNYKGELHINELYVMSAGERPDWIQTWEPTYDKADLLLVVAHPDDEYVFMGGVIPYYSVERGKRVLVAYITESTAERRTELLDGLWAVGHRSYPLVGKFYDRYTHSLNVAYEKLGKAKTQKYMVELFRKYQPQVVVTHDIHGEYGHGVHKVCADIVLNAMKKSADASKYQDLAKEYGVWDVPKVYLHLYPENQLVMDWSQPMAAFDGRSAFDMAKAGFACHLSQQNTEYIVYEDGPYDSRLFGLVRSLVGEDVEKNDFFENIDP